MTKSFTCPHCKTQIPLSVIPDKDLMSERGRRNAGRRRKHVGGVKGALRVWAKHASTPVCQCAQCLTGRVRRLRAALAQSEARSLATGIPVDQERTRRVLEYEERVRSALKTKGIVVESF